MKKIYNAVSELFIFLIAFAVFGYSGYMGFKDYVIGLYNTPIGSRGLFFFIFKYPGLICFFFISLGLSMFSIAGFVGFFLKLFEIISNKKN